MKTGETVAGRFRLLRLAGRGGMGVVWEAVDEQSGGRVAVKIVELEPGPRAEAQDVRARFGLEARALAEIRHPNVVRYMWHGVVGARGVVVMEWLEGSDLSTVLRGGPLPVAQALQVAAGLSRALAEAHARGVVHRDVKPSNVWITGDARAISASSAKLLDFGLAAMRADRDAQGRVEGTARYMAPEQARGDAPDARADYFSLGCVLYECLTGRPPFEADRTLAVLADVQLEDVPRPSGRRAEIPPTVDALVLALLARDPAARPRDAHELATLLAAASGRTSQAPQAATLRWVPVLLAEDGAEACPARAVPLGRGRYARLAAASHPGDAAKELAAVALELTRGRPRCAAWLGLVRLTEGGVGDLARLAEEVLRLAAPGRVLVAADLVPLLGSECRLERGAGLTWLELDGVLPGAAPSAVELVGREAELRLLVGTLRQCEDERMSRTILVSGPPGIGVSSLVRGAVEEGAPGLRWGRCFVRVLQTDRTEPLETLRSISTSLAATEAAPLDEAVSRALPAPEDALARAALRSLHGEAAGDVAAIPREGHRFSALVERALAGILTRAVAVRPLVFVLDDAHLADPATRLVLRGCRRATAALPITWLLAGREELEVAWAETTRGEDLLTVRVGPLRARAAERLAASVLGPNAEPTLARRVAQRAEGHPLVVLELARLGGDGDVPTAVQALVEARVSALSEPVRGVLCAASVLDEGVAPDVLAATVQRLRPELDVVLDELTRARLLELRDGVLHVPQALVREVARGMLPPSSRAELLARAALALERDPPSSSRTAEALERAGYAFSRAGDAARASVALARAASRFAASRRPSGAERAATAVLGQGRPGALSAAEADVDAVGLLELLASALALTRRPRPELASLLPAWIALLPVEQRGVAFASGARALAASGHARDAESMLSAARTALAAARRADAREAPPGAQPGSAGEVSVLVASVEVSVWAGEFSRAVAASDELERLGADRPLATLLKESNARAATGDPRGALRVLDRARAVAPPGDVAAMAEVAKFESLAHLFAREFEATARIARAAAELARAAGLPAQEAINLHNEGDALHRLGRFAEARAALERSTVLADAAEHPTLGAQNRLHLDYLAAREGSAEAEARLREGVASLEQRGQWGNAVDARVLLVRLAAARSAAEGLREGAVLLPLAREKGQLLAVADVEEALGRSP